MNPSFSSGCDTSHAGRTGVATVVLDDIIVKLKSLVLTMVVASAVITVGAASAAGTQFEKGVKAYIGGQYNGALAAWSPLAEKGNVTAMYHIAQMYIAGQLDKPEQAVDWFRRAADKQHAPSQIALGLAYANGRGVSADATEAERWWLKAAKRGDSRAQFYLGRLYTDGKLITADADIARGYLAKSSKQGDLRARALLDRINGKLRSDPVALATLNNSTDQSIAALGQALAHERQQRDTATSEQPAQTSDAKKTPVDQDVAESEVAKVADTPKQRTVGAGSVAATTLGNNTVTQPAAEVPVISNAEPTQPTQPTQPTMVETLTKVAIEETVTDPVTKPAAVAEEPEQQEMADAVPQSSPASDTEKTENADVVATASEQVTSAATSTLESTGADTTAVEIPATTVAATTVAEEAIPVTTTVNDVATESESTAAETTASVDDVSTVLPAPTVPVAPTAPIASVTPPQPTVVTEQTAPTTSVTETSTASEPPARLVSNETTSLGSAAQVTAVTAPTQVAALSPSLTSTSTDTTASLPRLDNTDKADDLGWLSSLGGNRFTIQLYVTSDRTSAMQFIDRHQLGEARYFRQKSTNASWYKIILGDFADAEAARVARAQLSGELQRYSPWIRSFESVQRELGLANDNASNTATEPPVQTASATATAVSSDTASASPQVPDRVIVPVITQPVAVQTTSVVTQDTTDSSPTESVTLPAVAAVSSQTQIGGSTGESSITPVSVDNSSVSDAEPASTTIQPIPGKTQTASIRDSADSDTLGAKLADRHAIDQIAYRTGQRAYNRRDYDNAMRLWEPLAQAKYADAQYGVGFMYEAGWGVSRDVDRAHYWYTLAAQQGYAKAQYQLGMLYLNGNGVPQDETIAAYWIQSAADQYDTRAAAELLRLRSRASQ